MGIDILDLTFRLEREFSVKLDRAPLMNHFYQDDGRWDIQVRDFIGWVRWNIENQTPGFDDDDAEVYQRVQQQIIECLVLDEAEVTPDAWLVRDLGLE